MNEEINTPKVASASDTRQRYTRQQFEQIRAEVKRQHEERGEEPPTLWLCPDNTIRAKEDLLPKMGGHRPHKLVNRSKYIPKGNHAVLKGETDG